jgi:hypothetical protein
LNASPQIWARTEAVYAILSATIAAGERNTFTSKIIFTLRCAGDAAACPIVSQRGPKGKYRAILAGILKWRRKLLIHLLLRQEGYRGDFTVIYCK